MARKLSELSSREDFAIEQFATMKKINSICSKLFELYFIDIELDSELSPMMRTMVPPYWIDPTNPEHPSCYILAGQSNVSYLERMIYIWPYVNDRNKFEYEISAYRGLIIPPLGFAERSKPFRKSKLEPLVVMSSQGNDRAPKTLILREESTSAKDELTLDFLQVPKRKRDGDEAYVETVNAVIYQPWYRYLTTYLNERELVFTEVPVETIMAIVNSDIADFVTADGDHITITKGILPLLSKDTEVHKYFIAKVPDPMCDTSAKRFHYVIEETFYNTRGTAYMSIYTLLAAMQLQ